MPLVKTSRFWEGVGALASPCRAMLSEWQDHEQGERGPCPLGAVSVGEDGEPVEVAAP